MQGKMQKIMNVKGMGCMKRKGWKNRGSNGMLGGKEMGGKEKKSRIRMEMESGKAAERGGEMGK